MTRRLLGPFGRPKCQLCGRPYEAHSLNTRDICNFYLEPDDDVRRTVQDREGDAGGAGSGGVVSGNAESKKDLRGSSITEGLQKLAAACRVKAELYAQAHPEIPASFRIIAVEIENILNGRPNLQKVESPGLRKLAEALERSADHDKPEDKRRVMFSVAQSLFERAGGPHPR